MPERTRWSRVFAEAFVVVGSILLAFGIQAWWEWRRDRNLERDALERLETDFVAMDSLLVAWRANHDLGLEACEALLSNTRPDGSVSLTDDSIASLLGTLRTAWTIDPPFATLSALESSGQVAIVRNQELLTQFASFRALMDDLQGDEVVLEDVKVNFLIPYLVQSVPLRAVTYRGPVASVEPDESAFPGGFGSILRSREFENIIVEVQRRTANSVGNYDAAHIMLTEIINMIRREVGRDGT